WANRLPPSVAISASGRSASGVHPFGSMSVVAYRSSSGNPAISPTRTLSAPNPVASRAPRLGPPRYSCLDIASTGCRSESSPGEQGCGAGGTDLAWRHTEQPQDLGLILVGHRDGDLGEVLGEADGAFHACRSQVVVGGLHGR